MNNIIKLKRYIYENSEDIGEEEKAEGEFSSIEEVFDVFQEALEMEFDRDKTLSGMLQLEVEDRDVYPSTLYQNFEFSNEKFKFRVSYILTKHVDGLDITISYNNITDDDDTRTLSRIVIDELSNLKKENVESIIASQAARKIIELLRLAYKKHELKVTKFIDILVKEAINLINKHGYTFKSVENSWLYNSTEVSFLIGKSLHELFFRFETKAFVVSMSQYRGGIPLSVQRFDIIDINIHEIIDYIDSIL